MINIINNLKQEFKRINILNKLLYINIGLFLLFSILGVFSFMFQFDMQPILSKLSLPADNNTFLHQPWAIISYMFLHNDFLHLLFNMIWLHFGGKIFLQYLNPKQLLSSYLQEEVLFLEFQSAINRKRRRLLASTSDSPGKILL